MSSSSSSTTMYSIRHGLRDSINYEIDKYDFRSFVARHEHNRDLNNFFEENVRRFYDLCCSVTVVCDKLTHQNVRRLLTMCLLHEKKRNAVDNEDADVLSFNVRTVLRCRVILQMRMNHSFWMTVTPDDDLIRRPSSEVYVCMTVDRDRDGKIALDTVALKLLSECKRLRNFCMYDMKRKRTVASPSPSSCDCGFDSKSCVVVASGLILPSGSRGLMYDLLLDNVLYHDTEFSDRNEHLTRILEPQMNEKIDTLVSTLSVDKFDEAYNDSNFYIAIMIEGMEMIAKYMASRFGGSLDGCLREIFQTVAEIFSARVDAACDRRCNPDHFNSLLRNRLVWWPVHSSVGERGICAIANALSPDSTDPVAFPLASRCSSSSQLHLLNPERVSNSKKNEFIVIDLWNPDLKDVLRALSVERSTWCRTDGVTSSRRQTDDESPPFKKRKRESIVVDVSCKLFNRVRAYEDGQSLVRRLNDRSHTVCAVGY